MSWNDKGGGPWGPPPGGNEPRRPSPQGNGPNDLEALLRKAQERLGQMLPGSGNTRLGVLAIAVVAAIVIIGWLMSGVYRVDPNEVAVIQRFGAFARLESLGRRRDQPAPDRDRLAQRQRRSRDDAHGRQ
jgi:membrane protease subunit HflK